jgi:hypothetical protein
MDDDQLIRAIATFVIVALLVPAVLWYLGIRFSKPQLKIWGVLIGAIYVLTFSFNLAHDHFDLFPVTYRTELQGPGVVDCTYPVNVPGSRHEMVLTPVPKYNEHPTTPLTLSFEVQSPTGQVVAKGQETLNWTPLKTQFTTPEQGEHKLILQIPVPARKVRIAITERKQ